MKMRISTHFAACLLLVCTTGQAVGAVIPVANPGFEDPVLADGTITNFFVNDWTLSATGVAGTWNPTTSEYPSEAPEGDNVSFVNGNLNYIVQDLNVFVAPNLIYTLEVDVGKRLDMGANWNYSVELIIAGTNDPAGILAIDAGSLAPNPGQFLTSTVTYTAPSSGPEIGRELAIKLRNRNTDQVNFDNVRLTAVPLPAAFYLFGAGLLGLVGIAGRKYAA